MGEWRIEQTTKIDFLTALAMVIKKDPTTSIRKHDNKLKVHKKIVRMPIKQDLFPDLNPFYYAVWGVLESKTNATSHPNISFLKATIEEEWNKIFEEFILKAYKSFRRHVSTIVEKMVAILSKFSVLCRSCYFVVYFFKLKLILFSN